MPKYLIEGVYSSDGAKGLASEGGSGRRKSIDDMVKGQQGSVESF